jgi:hypothetical protein
MLQAEVVATCVGVCAHEKVATPVGGGGTQQGARWAIEEDPAPHQTQGPDVKYATRRGTHLVSVGIGSMKHTCRMKGMLVQSSPRMPLT